MSKHGLTTHTTMRKAIITSTIIFLISLFWMSLSAQEKTKYTGYDDLPGLSKADSIGLVNLPELKMPEWLKGNKALELPHIVDNSEEKYWRPVFAQVQYECGQASGVGLGFTYAINRMRDLPSDEEENQYPSHFTWNFGNGGNGWYGVSYFHSFEIIKREGCPNVVDFGGMTGTGPEMWMTGYDKYYNAMHNRVADVYKIDLTTEEGINTLRNWIHNHLEGSDVGGIANFYTNAPSASSTLPYGTPEAGKYVVTSWSYANHGLTISGYHDSICWDYNNDGQYTNDIDLNGDGIITPRDWEIGGLRFANTYSGGPSWANSGFSYMTYKSCADPYGGGGIWDNAAHVVYAKANTEPLLTARVKIKYNCRDRLRIQMGMSTDVTSETPDYVLGFPLFNYQGGCQYMQGGNTNEDNKTIEIGLDITPFLNMMESGTPARFFLILDEDDPEGWAWGQMLEYAILDYTDGVEEIICEEAGVSIIPDDQTIFWVDHTVSYEGVEITTNDLPPATVYEPYTGQLEAAGGTEPYTWSYDMNFTETALSESLPMVDDEELIPSSSNDGYATKNLGFTFPFYDHEFDYVRVNVDGYISFENMFDWPYQVYDFFHYTKNKLISPFQADLRLYDANGDGLWYEGDENSATFRWQASVNGYQNNSELNFAVTLHKNGDIQFFYGNTEYPEMEWISGVSSGDNIFYQFTDITNDPAIGQDLLINLEATHYPDGFAVDRYGMVTGTATQVYDNLGVKFMVMDESNLKNSKVVNFSTDGSNYLVIKNVLVNSGGDDVIEYGETAVLSIEIESLGEETITGAEMTLADAGVYSTLVDSLELLGDFEPGEIKVFESAFSFEVGNSVPDGYDLDFPTMISDDLGEDWASHILLTAHAPNIFVSSIFVDDGGSGGLDPGETADLVITLHNDGGASASEIVSVLSSSDPFITINSNTASLDELSSGGSGSVVFNVTASEETPAAHIIELDVEINAANEYTAYDQTFVACGLLIEGFESGNFETYPWTLGGDDEWMIDNVTKYEGEFAARSGDIDDMESSFMELEMFVISDGEISFYRKVSSESNYDYLRFYMDGNMLGNWDGEQDWQQFTFPLTAGMHTFKWTFEKDYSVSTGSDCGWIDNITLPPYGDQNPQLWFAPENMLITIEENTVVQDTLHIYNAGDGPLIYTLAESDTAGNQVDWLILDSQGGGLNPGDADDVLVYFDGTELQTGLYEATIVITDHIDNEYLMPVWFYVDLGTGIDENTLLTGIRTMPNPFTSTTTLEFTLQQNSPVTVDVFNSRGEQVAALLDQANMPAGTQQVNWDALAAGQAPGLYYYRINAGDQTFTGKLLLID